MSFRRNGGRYISGNCKKCGTYRISLHRDHIVPKFEGGSDDESNVQFICANCHEDKTREDLKRFRHTEESKRKCGEANREIARHTTPHSQETKALISKRTSEAQLGRPCPWNARPWTPARRAAYEVRYGKRANE